MGNSGVAFMVWLTVVSLGLSACATSREDRRTEATPSEQASHGGHGRVEFKTSCNEAAQQTFEESLALLHHMMYHQARSGFQRAASQDPNCAMAHWGVAMTYFHPLWPDQPDEAELREGAAAVRRARSIEPKDPRERAFIDAVAEYYRDGARRTEAERLIAFELGMKRVQEAYPEDPDAVAFYALSHLATAPKGDATLSHQRRAGRILEALHARAPLHPGGFHYLIHAYDHTALAERAVDVARGYDRIAPEVPHALHMPSHIFVRLGIWPDTISWNRRSADAALKHPAEGGLTSMHYVHAMDYLVYGHLQMGNDRDAEAALREVSTYRGFEPVFPAAYALAAIPSRFALERHDWKTAAKVEPVSPTFPWAEHPAAEAIVRFARGLGAARSGELALARQEVSELSRLQEDALRIQGEYWAELVGVQRDVVQAWVQSAEGDFDGAISLLETAANNEDTLGKNPTTPGHVLPARELLGDMLVMAGRYPDALLAYQKSLTESPKRFNSLAGAFEAAKRSGNRELAQRYGVELLDVAQSQTGRTAVAEVRAWLQPAAE